MTSDEIDAHMKSEHGYPNPTLWTPKILREIHVLEHQLLGAGVIRWLPDMDKHSHA